LSKNTTAILAIITILFVSVQVKATSRVRVIWYTNVSDESGGFIGALEEILPTDWFKEKYYVMIVKSRNFLERLDWYNADVLVIGDNGFPKDLSTFKGHLIVTLDSSISTLSYWLTGSNGNKVWWHYKERGDESCTVIKGLSLTLNCGGDPAEIREDPPFAIEELKDVILVRRDSGKAIALYKTKQGFYWLHIGLIVNRGKNDEAISEIIDHVISAIVNRAPVAGFRFEPSSPTDLDTISFVDESYDPDGRVVRWLWDFGDGTSSPERSPKHRYADDGRYLVTLTVWDDKGASSTVTKTIVVRNVKPKAIFKFKPSKPYAGQIVMFDASQSYDPDGKVVRCEWDFDGDGHVDAEGIKVSYVYERAGEYIIRLAVIDDDNARVITEKTLRVLRRELPDLAVKASIPSVGLELRALNVSFMVSNMGRKGSGKFTVVLLVDESVVDEVSIGYLGPNSTARGVLVWASPSQGIHSVKVCADYEGVVEELDEGNNCFEGSVEIAPYPKLEVSAPEGLRLEANSTGLLKALVRNVGRVWARGVEVSLTLPEGVEPLTPLAKRLGDLGPSELAEVEWGLRALSPGKHVAEIHVRAVDMPEAKAYVLIYVARPMPDLEARLVMPGVAEEGYPVNVTAIAINTGKAGSGPFAIGLYLDEIFYRYKTVKDVRSNGKVATFFTLYEIKAGDHSVRVCADVFDEVHEVNESNNCAEFRFRVSKVPPRLKVIGFYAPHDVVVGEDFIILLAVENAGSYTATDVEARLILPPGISLASMEKASKPLGNIPPRKSVEVTWSLTGKEPGEYKVTARITAENASDVQEALKLKVLRPALLELDVELFDVTGSRLTQLKVGDVFRLVATVRNEGEESLKDITVSLDMGQAESVRFVPKERPSKRVGYLEGGSSKQVSWLLEAVSPGRSWIAVTASSGSQEDYEVVMVEVGD